MDNLMVILKALGDKRMSGTLEQMCRQDEDYVMEVSHAVGIQNQYETINLDKSSRDIIDNLLEARDCANMERVSLAYLAGMKDCLEILWELDLLQT